MYTAWNTPRTEEKAEHLTCLMRDPLPRKFAKVWLGDLMGDNDLFDDFEKYDADEDVRPLIKSYLKEWLDNLDRFYGPWESKAIELCKKLVAD